MAAPPKMKAASATKSSTATMHKASAVALRNAAGMKPRGLLSLIVTDAITRP